MLTEAAATRIACKKCGALVHSIQYHLDQDHPEMTLADYQKAYPGEPLWSEIARAKLAERQAMKEAAEAATVAAEAGGASLQPFHELFGLGSVPASLSSRGAPIPVTQLSPNEADAQMVPDLDPGYVFNLDVLKTLVMGIEHNIPTLVWGHAGTGKTTILEQLCARTRRPMIRVQHTANMEETHVTGQMLLRDGKTVFELGPLAMAMRYGWTYLADEYDFGRPEVLSVYQPVLEGKSLVIKEADIENRVIKPHPNFRFVATGNTNGTGDETGLYAGTNIQNAANYERFGITEKMPYMEPEMEARLVSNKGEIAIVDARKLVDFATRIRTEYDGSRMSSPISPRTLIFAARLGKARANWRFGLERAFINRMSSVDRETANQLAQRVFA